MNPANFGHREREKVNINTNSIRQGTMKTPTAQKVAHRNFIYFACSTKKATLHQISRKANFHRFVSKLHRFYFHF